MMNQLLLFHFLLFLPIMVVAQTKNLQAKAESQGAGGNVEVLFEPRQCLPFDDQTVQVSAAKTVGQCKTNLCAGCCRFHTAFLTCDTSNIYRQQQCVCNDRTNNGGGGILGVGDGGTIGAGTITGGTTGTVITTGGTTGTVIATGGTTGTVITTGGTIGTGTGTATGDTTGTGTTSEGSIATGSNGANTCANGSTWQERGFHFQNCASGAECNEVKSSSGAPTCCKKTFCWCGAYDEASEECVA
jgi:hypothetical protein